MKQLIKEMDILSMIEKYVDKQYIANNIVNILVDDNEKKQIFTEEIYQLELESKILFKYSTYRSCFFRSLEYKNSIQRKILNDQIFKELISLNSSTNEDNICLGVGGCKPEFITKNCFFQIIGLPGAGKTYLASIISQKYGSYLIDSDFVKRKFPEYESYKCSSSLLHEEANEISYSLTNNSVFNYCLYNRYSMVVPRIGHLYQSLSETLKLVKVNGYHIYLILLDISPADAIKSCYERYSKNKRYMPLIKLLKECGTSPKTNYSIIRNCNYISGYALINVDLSRKYNIIESFCSD